MNNQAIGIFDSGLGGLTIVQPLMEALPQERFIYYGDTARTPYGSKSVSTIQHFSREIVDFLKRRGCKAIVIACNTVSSTSIAYLEQEFPDLPFVGIIEPIVQEVVASFQPLAGAQVPSARKLAVIGTKVTIESGVYQRLFHEALPHIPLYEQACPLFVPLIEEACLDHQMMDLAISYYLDDFVRDNDISDLILGCTHYHLLEAKLQKRYPHLTIWNPAAAQIRALELVLARTGLASTFRSERKAGQNFFYASDLSENFRSMIKSITAGHEAEIHFKTVEESLMPICSGQSLGAMR